MTQSIHDLDLMCHLLGRPIEVTAAMDTLKEPIESEDTCAATVRFESGAMACCYGTMTAHRTASAFDVIGESASAHLPWALECTDRKRREQLLREVWPSYPPVAGAGLDGRDRRRRLARGCGTLRRAARAGARAPTRRTWQMSSMPSKPDGRCLSDQRRRAPRSISAPRVYVSALTRRRSRCRSTVRIPTTPA